MKRRSFLKLSASSSLAVALGTPAVLRAQTRRFEGITLNINGYGGDYSRILNDYVAKPLAEQTGLKVAYQDGTAASAIAKLIASRDRPPYDIIMADSPNIPELIAADLIDPVTRDELPNGGKLLDSVREFGDHGTPFLTNSIVLTYNSDLIKQPIASYKDLARSDLNDRVGLLSPENTGGVLGLIALAEAYGGSLDNMQPAFDALADMRDNISTITPATVSLLQLFEQEEVWAGPFWDGRIYSMRAKKLPMKTVVPQEGIYALYNYLAPVKGSQNRDAALAYINQALSDKAVGAMVEFFRYAPCTDIHIDPAVAADVVGYGEGRKLVKPVDWVKVSKMRGAMLEQFNKSTR